MQKILSASPYFWEKARGVDLAKRHEEGKLSFLLPNQPPACDARCRRCFMPPERRDRTKGALTLDEWKKVLEDGLRMGVLSLEFSGEGEPLRSKMTLPLVQYAASMGILSTLITNGHEIDEAKIEELANAGATLVFSLHTLNRTGYESDNGYVGSFETKMKAIEMAAEMFRGTTVIENGYSVSKLAIHTILQADNQDEVGHLREFCHEHEIFFSIAPLAQTGNALLHPEIRTANAGEGIVGLGDGSIIHSETSRRIYGREVCGTAAFGMSIGFEGNLLLDAHGGYEIGSTLGNIRSDSFETLYRTWKMAIEQMFRETVGFCPVRDGRRFEKFVRKLTAK